MICTKDNAIEGYFRIRFRRLAGVLERTKVRTSPQPTWSLSTGPLTLKYWTENHCRKRLVSEFIQSKSVSSSEDQRNNGQKLADLRPCHDTIVHAGAIPYRRVEYWYLSSGLGVSILECSNCLSRRLQYCYIWIAAATACCTLTVTCSLIPPFLLELCATILEL